MNFNNVNIRFLVYKLKLLFINYILNIYLNLLFFQFLNKKMFCINKGISLSLIHNFFILYILFFMSCSQLNDLFVILSLSSFIKEPFVDLIQNIYNK